MSKFEEYISECEDRIAQLNKIIYSHPCQTDEKEVFYAKEEVLELQEKIYHTKNMMTLEV